MCKSKTAEEGARDQGLTSGWRGGEEAASQKTGELNKPVIWNFLSTHSGGINEEYAGVKLRALSSLENSPSGA